MDALAIMPEVVEAEAKESAEPQTDPAPEPPRRGRPAKVTGDQLSTLGSLSQTLTELGMSEANVIADMAGHTTNHVEHFDGLNKAQAEKLIERWGRLIAERQAAKGQD